MAIDTQQLADDLNAIYGLGLTTDQLDAAEPAVLEALARVTSDLVAIRDKAEKVRAELADARERAEERSASMRQQLDGMRDVLEDMQQTHEGHMERSARRAAYARGWTDRHRARWWRGWGFR